MSVFFLEKKGWRYDFRYQKIRYTKTGFKTKKEAKKAEAKKKEELSKKTNLTPIDMDFLTLINKRLDYVTSYYSASYFKDNRLMAKRWCRAWRGANCSEITKDEVQSFILKRAKNSAYAANYDLRSLRALFNFGIKRNWIKTDPTKNIAFLPIEKKIKYIPPKTDLLKVILAADNDTKDYLWTIEETLGRMSEINRLTWNDVDFNDRSVTLYTRKKKGGHLTPRKVGMTTRLYDILYRRYQERDKAKPWVFWHTYWSSKTGEKKEGPYQDRKKIMRTLCQKAGVKYFRYHALRHLGASILDNKNVPMGDIQKILGHENRSTTEIYLQSIGQSERKAMEVLEQAWED